MHGAITTPEVLTFEPSFAQLAITPESIERGLGYRGAKISPAVQAALQELLPSVPEHAELRCGIVILPQDAVMMDHDFTLAGSHRLNLGTMIAERLSGITTLALWVATAGPGLERWASSLMKSNDVVKGFIVDAIGSETAEQTANWVEGKLADVAAQRGWKITNRYSPGYCGWPTADQQKLFSLLPKEFCGIRLTESALMIPIKSVSGVIGLGPEAKREGYQCGMCELQDCFRRKNQ